MMFGDWMLPLYRGGCRELVFGLRMSGACLCGLDDHRAERVGELNQSLINVSINSA